MAGFLLFLFWLLCLAMLAHVWWRRDPWPVLGSATGTRLFWTGSLAALPNPLTLVLYAIFGGWASRRWEKKGRPRPSTALRGTVVALMVLLAAAAWLPQPGAGSREHAFHTPQEARAPYAGLKVAVAATGTEQSHSSSTVHGGAVHMPPGAHVDVVLRHDSPFLMEVARGIAGKVLEDSRFASVNVRAVGVEPEDFPRDLPVTTIHLDWKQERGLWLPGKRRHGGEIYWRTGHLNSRDFVHTGTLHSVDIQTQGRMRFQEDMSGFATRSAVLRDAGQHYGPKVAEAILSTINQQSHHGIPYGSVPPTWNLPWRPTPEMEEILADTPELHLVQKGTLPLVEHLSVYESDPVVSAPEWMEHWSAMLEQQGWRLVASREGEMRAFERDSRAITLRTEAAGTQPFGSQRAPDDGQSGRRMHLQAHATLDSEQLAALVEDLIESDDAPPALLLMTRSSVPPQQGELILRRLAETTPRTLAELHAIADMTARGNTPATEEVERARELIGLAEILRLTHPRHAAQVPSSTSLDNLRKRAGLEDWHPEPLGDARFRRAGLHPLQGVTDPMEFVLPAGESPSFYYLTGEDYWNVLSLDIDARETPSGARRYTRREALVRTGSSASGTWVTHGPQDLQRTSGGAWETRTMIRKPGGGPGEYGHFIFRVEDMGDEWRWTVSTEERGTARSNALGPAI